MTDKQLLEQALEALQYHTSQTRPITKTQETIAAIQARLEQPEQEPYGYFRYDMRLDAWVQNREGNRGVAFYTVPPAQRQWVGLTDEEILKLAYPIRWQEVDDFEADKAVNFAQVIETKLKEKNT